MKIYVMRHGEVNTNIKNEINARNNEELNENGIMQSKKASWKVEKLEIDLIICSPLKRSIETCEYANANKKEVIFDDRLMERDSKSMEFQPIDNLDLELWYDIEKDNVYKDSEGFKKILQRVYNFLDEVKIKYSGKNILLITHGDICKAIYMYFNRDINPKEIFNVEQKNCEIKEYEI